MGAILPDHGPPGITVVANLSSKVTQEDEAISRRSTFKYLL